MTTTSMEVAKYGQKMKYDPAWRGPCLHNRSCTDCFWLCVFVGFLAIWSGVAYYALWYGNIEKLVQPTDSEGRKCGIDSQVSDRPYLLFFDLTKCVSSVAAAAPEYRGRCLTTQVCIKECPRENFIFDQDAKSKGLDYLRANLICKIEVKLDKVSTIDDVEKLVMLEKCTKWYVKSGNLFGRCFPKTAADAGNQFFNETALQGARRLIESVAHWENVFKKAYIDVKNTKYTVLGISITSGLVSLLYVVVLRWLAGPCIWTTISTICAALGYATYESTLAYLRNGQNIKWLLLLVVVAIVFTLLLLAVLFLRKRIYLATRLIKESSRAVTSILSSLFFPLVPWLLHMLVLTYSVTIFLHLLTIWEPNYRVQLVSGVSEQCICTTPGKYTNNSVCVPEQFNRDCYQQQQQPGGPCVLSGCNLVSKNRPWYMTYLHVINIVGFYWLFFFVSAFGEMVLAATFSIWYWTCRKRDVPYFTITIGFWRTIRYHMGTLALGALILTVCRIIGLALEWLNKRVKKASNNKFVNGGIMCCCKCVFYVLENFLRFINNNAYVMCAVHGKGFCRSARDAFNLLMRNVVQAVVVNKITSWLLLLGKVSITGTSVVATYWYYDRYYQAATAQNKINYSTVPAMMTAVASFLIATVFFKVHAAATDTLFLCFLEDCERNDGSKESPYYTSKRLRKLLHK